ncbi:unnamed protein product, partial [Mesorhabditis belari]|uniref:Uncharacterized protein n=1 Tax=Mesorhabditis belari TaxID=2138241 RepID=A0AAF3EF73_9BILA
MKQFEGKVALVTGSSNGIGRGIAVHFVKNGAKVTLTGRSVEALEEAKKECVEAGASDGDLLILPGNLGEEEFMDKLINETVEKFGRLDFLINNAGVSDEDFSGKQPGFFSQDLQSYDYILKINLRCVIYLCRQSAPHLEKVNGAIVNISSIAASEVQGCGFSYYSVSKAALDQLTRNLALEMIRRGVRVNGIKPGAVRSTIMLKQGADQSVIDKIHDDCSNRFDMIPARFVADPIDVAKLTAFLCDNDQSRYLIGQSIRLDGGSSLVNTMLLGSFAEYKNSDYEI